MKRTREEQDDQPANQWKCESCRRNRAIADKLTQWTDPFDNGCGGEQFDVCVFCHDAGEGRRPEFVPPGATDDTGSCFMYGFGCGEPTCHERREHWCAAHASMSCSERARARCCMGGSDPEKQGTCCRVAFCTAVDGIPHGRHYREGQPCLDCRQMLWRMVEKAHPNLSKYDSPTSQWQAARQDTFQAGGGRRPTGVASENTYLTCPVAEKDECKQLGGRWDAGAKKWFVPKGKQLGSFSKWL